MYYTHAYIIHFWMSWRVHNHYCGCPTVLYAYDVIYDLMWVYYYIQKMYTYLRCVIFSVIAIHSTAFILYGGLLTSWKRTVVIIHVNVESVPSHLSSKNNLIGRENGFFLCERHGNNLKPVENHRTIFERIYATILYT